MRESNQGQVYAVGAMVLLVAAVLMVGGRSSQAASRGSESHLQAIETGADHIEPSALADRILAGGTGMLLVDVRPAEEFAAFHLPRAVNMTLPQVTSPATAALLRQHELVVLYSNGPTHPGQAWVELRAAGHDHVRVLDGGLERFRAEVLTPASLRPDGDEAKAKAEAASMALVRTFFLSPVPEALALSFAMDPEQLTQPTVVTPRWLAARLGKVAVLDTRGSAADYTALHVPTAVHFPEKPLRLPHGTGVLFLGDAKSIAAALGKAGVRRDQEVVICADDRMQDATLVALALLRAGHQKLAILEGGLLRWAAERQPLVRGAHEAAPTTYEPAAGADDFTIDAAQLHASLASGMKVLDVRPGDFFRGEKSTEARPGHIPGAVNRPYQQDLERTADGNYWRKREDLTREYAALGIHSEQPVTVSCRTGHTASESFFVLRYLLGYQNVRWYNGSWTDWAERSELPAELGATK